MDLKQSIEPVYESCRRKVMEKSRGAYAPNPYIGGSDARDPEVVAVIGFAADDRHALVTPLEQAFYDYCGLAGWDAFNEIPVVFERARARLEADDKTREIGRAHVGTPVTNAHLICRHLHEKKKHT